MRTLNEDFVVKADSDNIRNRNLSYNSSFSSNYNYNNVGKSNGYGYGYNDSQYNNNNNSNSNSSSAIPYHARENSLPFSYGQIGKTSTPLKSVVNSAGAGAGASAGGYRNIYGNSSYNDNDSAYFSGNGHTNDANYHGLIGGGRSGGGGSATTAYRPFSDNNEVINGDAAGTIKTQSRLKSPLLVRKTLNGHHSPTRAAGLNGGFNSSNSANATISNSHYFKSNGNFSGAGGLSPNTNGNDTLSGNNLYGTTTAQRQRTPTRNDFEDLLRERREKVFNEHRESTKAATAYHMDNLVPPPRQFRGEDTTDAIYATPRHRKLNYDFEFHLNLDEDNDDLLRTSNVGKVPPQPPVRRASSNAMEQYISNSHHTFGKREQLQREQYRTRDIELPPLAPRDVERNYHTLSSSTYTTNAASQLANNRYLEQPSPFSHIARDMAATERYFETYEQRRQQTQSLPQPQSQRQQLQPQSIQQQQRVEYTTTTAYGNGNATGYGYNNNNNNRSNDMTESTNVYRSSLDIPSPSAQSATTPIYATSTKQVTKSNIVRDYPSPRSMASPGTPLFSRPETPAFPLTPRTPFGTMQNGSVRRLDHQISNGSQQYGSESIYQLTAPRQRLNSNFSIATTNAEPQEVAAHLVKFAKDSSKFWYKPNLGRDDAISLLINAPPGTFVVRDSTTYKSAYGLVLRVAEPPPNSQITGKPDELVRHFLIEPTTRGVRLKGCANEPVFTSLSALVYEHSINRLALPCLLRIPDEDLTPPLVEPTPAQKQLLTQGAACNVLWLFSCDTESLTGEEAIRKAIRQLYAQKPLPTPTEVHFKVSQQGITLTDNTRKKFFRKHYAAEMISFCAIDPDHRMWSMEDASTPEGSKSLNVGALKKNIFAFVARRSPSSKDNQCHVFCDLAINQPATAIVSFANRTLPTEKQRNYAL